MLGLSGPVRVTDNLVSFEPFAVAVLLFLLHIFVLGMGLRGWGRENHVPLVLSFVLPTGLVILKLSLGTYLTDDELIWHSRGIQALQHLRDDPGVPPLSDFDGKNGYVWLLGIQYYIAGPAPLVPILFGGICFTVLATILVRLSNRLTDIHTGISEDVRRKSTSVGISFFVAFPAVLFWVPSVLRETLCWALIAVVLLCCVEGILHRNMLLFAAALPALGLLYLVRDTVGTGIALAFVAAIVFAWPASQLRLAVRALLVIISAGALVPMWGMLSQRFGLSSGEVSDLTESLSRDASTAISVSESGPSLYVQLFLRVLLGPFPWEWNASGGMLLSLGGLVIWAGALVLAVRYKLPEAKDERRNAAFQMVVSIAIFALVALVMVSFSAGNYGIVTRFRIMPLVSLMPIAIAGLAYRWQLRRNSRSMSAIRGRQSQKVGWR